MHGAKRGKSRRNGYAATSRIPRPNAYLSQSGAKSQGIKQLMAGGGIALVGMVLVPLLSGLFS